MPIVEKRKLWPALGCAWLGILHAGAGGALVPERPATGTAEGGAAVSQIAIVGDRTFFRVQPQAGSADPAGLWASDGTAAGTVFLGPRLPIANELEQSVLASIGPLLYYYVETARPDGEAVDELWRSDGTPSGTFRLAETHVAASSRPLTLFRFGRRAVFTRCDELGCEPWITNGTVAGTRLLRDVVPGGEGSEPHGHAVLQGSLYFLAGEIPGDQDLWRSDGTTGGTVRVSDLPASDSLAALGATREALYLVTTGLSGPIAGLGLLWRGDGTAAGFQPLPPFTGDRPRGHFFYLPMGAIDDTFYFVASIDEGSRFQLWKMGGATGNTRRLLELDHDPGAGGPQTRFRGRDFFLGPGHTLWSTRGTATTTLPVVACNPRCPAELQPLQFGRGPEVIGDRLLFTGLDARGTEPWVSDGTAAGTRILADLCPGPCPSYAFQVARDEKGIYLGTAQGELWLTDGTRAGTIVLTGEGAAPGGAPEPALAFARLHPVRGGEIWRTDGTPAGTYPVRKFEAAGANLEPPPR